MASTYTSGVSRRERSRCPAVHTRLAREPRENRRKCYHCHYYGHSGREVKTRGMRVARNDRSIMNIMNIMDRPLWTHRGYPSLHGPDYSERSPSQRLSSTYHWGILHFCILVVVVAVSQYPTPPDGHIIRGRGGVCWWWWWRWTLRRGTPPHVAHVCDVVHVPHVHGLVESRRPIEHEAHVGDATDIPRV